MTSSYLHSPHPHTILHANTGASVDACFCYFDHQHTLRAQSSTFTIADPHAESLHSHHVAAGHSEQTPFEIQVYRKRFRCVTRQFYMYLILLSTDLLCRNLRSKLFGAPDPFLKLHVTCRRGGTKLPHHSQKASTEPLHGTVNPTWTEVTRLIHYSCQMIVFKHHECEVWQ